MKTLKFKLYQHKTNRYLKRIINAAGVIYNHCIALHKRYYRMWGKHLSCAKLQSHIAKLRKRNSFWQLVGSQAVQDICQRIEKAYQLFFKHHKRKVRAEASSDRNFARGGVKPPGFKKVKKYKSFTLKQAGYKFLGGNRVKMGQKVYQFWKSREIEGTVKTLTIKRTPLGELFMVVVVDNASQAEVEVKTGKIAGFDFGLKTFLTLWVREFAIDGNRQDCDSLTCSDGTCLEKSLLLGSHPFGRVPRLEGSGVEPQDRVFRKIESPQFFKQSLNAIKKASRQHSKKLKGSVNRERARKNLVCRYEAISHRRRDWFWKLRPPQF
jgi:putative transposase